MFHTHTNKQAEL